MEGEATWARLSELLDEVLELAPEARMPWIDRLTGADTALAPRLRSLLARAAADDAEFLRTLPGIELAATAGNPSEDAGVTAGALVGAYRTSRVIGEGGMGAVWLAPLTACTPGAGGVVRGGQGGRFARRGDAGAGREPRAHAPQSPVPGGVARARTGGLRLSLVPLPGAGRA